MWRDLLFYIKKGANWSFPLGVEGIKSDFIRFMCDTLYFMSPRRREKKNIGISDKKGPLSFCKLKALNHKNKKCGSFILEALD